MPIGDIESAVEIKTPEAIPLLFAFLIAYFSLRLWVEWKDTPIPRKGETLDQVKARLTQAAIQDSWLTGTIAALAIVLFVGQRTTGVQVANFLVPGEDPKSLFWWGLYGFGFGSLLLSYLSFVLSREFARWNQFTNLFHLGLLALTLLLMVSAYVKFHPPDYYWLLVIWGFLLGAFLMFIRRMYQVYSEGKKKHSVRLGIKSNLKGFLRFIRISLRRGLLYTLARATWT